MSNMIPVINRANIPADQFDPLKAMLYEQVSLERALGWFFSRQPPLVPEDLIAQDEYSHDLLVPYPGGLYLSYDTS